MRKKTLLISIVLLSFFMLLSKAKAYPGFQLVENGPTCTTSGDYQNCKLTITTKSSTSKKFRFKVRWNMENVTYIGVYGSTNFDVELVEEGNNYVIFESTSKTESLAAGTYELYSARFKKINSAEECLVTFSPPYDVQDINPICKYVNGAYYNSSGQEVSATAWAKDCNPGVCTSRTLEDGKTYYYDVDGNVSTSPNNKNATCNCGYKDGKYYDNSGSQYLGSNAAINWAKECKAGVCTSKTLEDGKTYYYDIDGNVSTSPNNKNATCNCAYKDGKYYSTTGTLIGGSAAALTWAKDCNPGVCTSKTLSDGNTYYYDINGNASTSSNNKNTTCKCEYKDGKYYDASGNVMTGSNVALNWAKACSSGICTSKKLEDGKTYYYDIDGNVSTSPNNKNATCNCGYKDGKYYNTTGTLITGNNAGLSWAKMCHSGICTEKKLPDNKTYYYDKTGNASLTKTFDIVKTCSDTPLVCVEKDGFYFGSNSQQMANEKAMIENCKCRIDGNKYYNDQNEEVSASEYIMSCLKITCGSHIINGKTYYFDKDGKEVSSALDVKRSCDKMTCIKIDDNDYYDKDGNHTTKYEDYIKSCFSCQILEDGKYVKKDGTITDSEDEYKASCETYKCEFKYNNYYDKKGNIVDAETFEKECNPKCEFKDGAYYNKDGKSIDKETFEKECNPKCEQKNGKYYDKDGKEVSKEDYIDKCNPKCEIIDNKYYDKKGNEVTKAEYDKACPNPNTGSSLPIITVLSLLLIGGGAYIISSKKNKLFKI